ncbi:accessory gene regulator B [Paenibacillus mucilaginosus]|uniref:accessory gene regulator B family protein n=1 Tax=Paenibacillus mucilaginosus TaxID=61624 RepID=UPI003D21DE28
MNWIDRTAMKLAVTIRNHDPEASSEKILFYSLSLLINTLTAVTSILLIAISTGHLTEGIIAILTFLIIRNVTGGFHLKSSWNCCLFTILLVTTPIFFHYPFWNLGGILNLLSLIIVFIKAPQGINNVSRIDPKYHRLLKFFAMLLIILNFFIESPLIATIFFLQSLTLLNSTYTLVSLIERRWVRHENQNC